MKPSRPISFVLALALAAGTASLALAWPDQPPDRVTLSGPGLEGDIEITDPQTLAAFKLGALEDFNVGGVAAPQVSGDGYRITRYFGGDFNFASLRYYPSATGPGALYFEDGPRLQGSHTPFDKQWLAVNPAGEAALKQVLADNGVSFDPPASVSPAVAPLPAAAWPWLATLLPVTALAAGLFVARRRPATPTM